MSVQYFYFIAYGTVQYGLALVEMTAVVEGANVFCQATYTLEGNDTLILTGNKVHDAIESEIETMESSTSLVKTRRACKVASNHMITLGVSTICFLMALCVVILLLSSIFYLLFVFSLFSSSWFFIYLFC